MQINPVNVINLLLVTFQSMNIPNSPISQQEIELKDQIEIILRDAMDYSNVIETISDETLDFQEEYKDNDAQIIEDIQLHWIPDVPSPPTDVCTTDYEELSYDYKRRAVEYWRSGKKKNLSLESVRQKFRKVQSISQLKRWAHHINNGGTYREKVGRICAFTLKNFRDAIEAGLIVHDVDLQKWALKAQKEIGLENMRFKASKNWLLKFKKAHRIVSRKVNKFVTTKTLQDSGELIKRANDFINTVKEEINKYGIKNIYITLIKVLSSLKFILDEL
jgi:hypothetical protein